MVWWWCATVRACILWRYVCEAISIFLGVFFLLSSSVCNIIFFPSWIRFRILLCLNFYYRYRFVWFWFCVRVVGTQSVRKKNTKTEGRRQRRWRRRRHGATVISASTSAADIRPCDVTCMNLSRNLFNNARRGISMRNEWAIFLHFFPCHVRFFSLLFFDIHIMHSLCVLSRVYFYFEVRKRFCIPQLYAIALDSPVVAAGTR